MRSRLFLCSFAVLAALAAPAYARGTLDSILPQIRQAHPGRLSDAEPWTDSEGRTHYKIKWMTPEGRILYFNADAASGHYSSSSGDDGPQRDWHDNDRLRGGDEDAPPEDGNDSHRSHWNGDDSGGDGNDRHGGDGDWHRRDRGQGDGDNRGGRGQGDWRGGGNRGDNGGHHNHSGN
ncbi:MAG TPA: hypothetical protein VNU97_12600 [Rhizomicrobium sp.]|nr:hypothetical protein [Rhizomicrobium sp.]